MADHLSSWHHAHLNPAELLGAYRALIDLFARRQIPASFAFVMAFLLDEGEQRQMDEWIADCSVDGSNWQNAYRAARTQENLAGWSCPELLDLVRSAGNHEVACHGFTHLPLAEELVTRSDAKRELDACAKVAAIKGLDLKTFVYPRNLKGYPDVLAAAGYSGFRARPPSFGRGLTGKARALLAELNPRARAQPACPPEAGMTVIPSGYFLNWQNGARRLVPRAASRRRWHHILDNAADTGATAHIWLHPHNIIGAPGTLERLEDVLCHAAKLRDAGRLEIMTQADYCANGATND